MSIVISIPTKPTEITVNSNQPLLPTALAKTDVKLTEQMSKAKDLLEEPVVKSRQQSTTPSQMLQNRLNDHPCHLFSVWKKQNAGILFITLLIRNGQSEGHRSIASLNTMNALPLF